MSQSITVYQTEPYKTPEASMDRSDRSDRGIGLAISQRKILRGISGVHDAGTEGLSGGICSGWVQGIARLPIGNSKTRCREDSGVLQ